jgi:adenine-specific DNA-methyltransferase
MRYIGNKTNILHWIKNCIDNFLEEDRDNINTFYDLFSGTGSVSEYFKNDYNIVGNDILISSCIITKAKLLNDIPSESTIDYHISILNTITNNGFITEKYSEGSRLYFSKINGQKIDGIMQYLIDQKDKKIIDINTYHYLLYCVLDSIHKISNTTGVYGAYLKTLSSNAKKDLIIQKLDIISSNKTHHCYNLDSIDLLDKVKENDIIYLDPPYNSRQYGSNYHLLETIIKYDNPTIKQINGNESITGLREDIISSKWCSKKYIKEELTKVLECKSKYICMSYNNEGLLTETEIKTLMENYGNVTIFKTIHKKYKSNKNNNKKEIEEILFCLKK